MNPQRHYRQDLNNHAIQAGLALTYGDPTAEGPQNSIIWTVIAYIDGIEHGRGSSSSKGQAKEIAAYNAMSYLGLDVN
ncbi:uncharacterized protein EV420DRAFT_115004 [Desarmillaria tabescens]|uniref:DRBM domain-containing protein n=1 Tax=Armillaria tabescens TaxID=1929756 RepID=A0AA39NRC3_ARMTA|nr:uncharacterized protein EV420DRAFT_115004 [Desarmillaria tabescens]KAK0470439.1 hypothetical protein EV420DRAFT_115004 [Desarmillaria tabescens]